MKCSKCNKKAWCQTAEDGDPAYCQDCWMYHCSYAKDLREGGKDE